MRPSFLFSLSTFSPQLFKELNYVEVGGIIYQRQQLDSQCDNPAGEVLKMRGQASSTSGGRERVVFEFDMCPKSDGYCCSLLLLLLV